MKNVFGYILLVSVILSSCRKDDAPAFEKSADERLNEVLTNYQNQLTSAENGWKAVIYPAGGGAFSFYFKFNASNRVNMVSDFDSASAVTLKESSYRLKALQQPSLVFDTYSYVHVLADPNENVGVKADVNGGPVGVGLKSDFEFYFDSSSTDTINLIGRMNGSKAVLVKATPQEAQVFTSGAFNINQFRSAYGRILEYFKRLSIGGQTYELNINNTTRRITFNWLDASNNLQSFSSLFYFNTTGIGFVTPFNTGTTVISELRNVNWVSASNSLTVTIGTVTGTIAGAKAPLKIDISAPQRWRQYAIDNGNDYWYSPWGWHSNGVDDVLNLRTSIPGYNYVIYGPRGYGGWTGGDLCGVIHSAGNGARAASYAAPPAIANGIIKFTWLQSNIGFGSALPAAANNLIYGTTNSIRAYLTDPDGFYLVQTGPSSYDMVETAEAKTWISWLF
ncbi:DUF4302 domain-containing protein [Segetibacter sp. 3557_3]|uniref:DUF4302 domain-containing protein n=1 Tax=Segetibacter sp. 3557_3 TaxID=2547429 RepID=UPI0010589342|nr:DUF4302 domain-containing protein [Segetibacter sp. 3557_3]TDH26833.1 DUF4302 domain-containing protein [Segetibacter sp. 3557_3]